MISKRFFEALTDVAADRGLEIESVLNKVRFAMEKAARFAGFVGDIVLDVDNDILKQDQAQKHRGKREKQPH